MEFRVNPVYLKNAAQMFRNIELLKMATMVDENGQQFLELVFYKPDNSEFNVYGASGKMLQDSLIEAIDSQYNQCRFLTLDKNIFTVTFEPKKDISYRIKD